MAVTYDTIEKVEEFSYPAWSTTHIGQDGCAGIGLTNGANSRACPSGSTAWYTPYSEIVVRDDRHIKGIRSGYPPYRYTPRFVSRTITRNHLLKRNNGGNGLITYQQYGYVAKSGGTCTRFITRVDVLGPGSAKWREVTHSFVGTDYIVNAIDQADIVNAGNKLMDEISVEALSSYDALTELAEFREVPRLVSSICMDLKKVYTALLSRFGLRDCRAAAHFKPLYLLQHPNKVLRKIGGFWMAQRYGIMPLVYSYRDIQKTINRGAAVQNRKRSIIVAKPTGIILPAATSNYKWTEEVGEVTVSANVFQWFRHSDIARLAGLSINPLVTAWELMPYSFVADWFFNVGDYITRRCSLSLSHKHWACLSRRTNITKKTWVHYKQDNLPITYSNDLPVNWYGSTPPVPPPGEISRPEENQLLKEVETQSYSRGPFQLSGAQLSILPSMNWRRLVDSAVMSLNQYNALVRRFR